MNNEKKFEFQVDDIVEWGGIQGKVLEIEPGYLEYPLGVLFEKDMSIIFFTKDGRYKISHEKPSITLIKRPKQKVKKYKVLYRDAFNNYNVTAGVYADKKEFDLYIGGYHFIQLIKESEIEVEE